MNKKKDEEKGKVKKESGFQTGLPLRRSGVQTLLVPHPFVESDSNTVGRNKFRMVSFQESGG